MNNLEKIFTIKNTEGPKVYAWNNERSEFVREDSTITINWQKLSSVLIVEPIKFVIGYVNANKSQMLLVGVGGLAIYGLYQQKRLILVFLGEIKSLEAKILSGAIKFDLLEELYDEVLAMAQNAIKQLNLAEKLQNLYSLEIGNLKTEALELNKLAYFQQEALKLCEKGSSNLSNANALEYLHKVADSEAQKSERISKLIGKMVRKQQGRIH
jgi:hypothetical protein